MSFDFLREPAMFERAFGPVWGFRIWRGLVGLGTLAFVGAVIFWALRGFATLRSDYTHAPRIQADGSMRSVEKPNPSESMQLSAPNGAKFNAAPAVELPNGTQQNCVISGGTNSGVQIQNCN